MSNSNTLSPLDNRYENKIIELKDSFSYLSWYKYRLYIEIEYFKLLFNILYEKKCTNIKLLNNIYTNFSDNELSEILEIEKTTFHDIKSIEIYLRNQYIKYKIDDEKYKTLIHFGLTSQDINSVAFSLQLKHAMDYTINISLDKLLESLNDLTIKSKSVPLLALTHGQPAIPTTLDKEINVFISRLNYNFSEIKNHKYMTKFGGAIGKLNAHYYTYPKYNWDEIFNNFITKLGLTRWKYTTQISNYEDIIRICSYLLQINNTLNDFCVDIWLYISRCIFKLHKENENQVGSSTMPQKVNPIDFENAEGNLKIANCGLRCFIDKLSSSRLQRDLSDSTVLRNMGVYLGHCLLSYKSIIKGIAKLELNLDIINKELENNPEILGEAIQSLLRSYHIDNAYNIIRKQTQNIKYNNEQEFKNTIISNINQIDGLDNDTILDITTKIKNLSVYTY